jgi:hypothetical protein
MIDSSDISLDAADRVGERSIHYMDNNLVLRLPLPELGEGWGEGIY